MNHGLEIEVPMERMHDGSDVLDQSAFEEEGRGGEGRSMSSIYVCKYFCQATATYTTMQEHEPSQNAESERVFLAFSVGRSPRWD